MYVNVKYEKLSGHRKYKRQYGGNFAILIGTHKILIKQYNIENFFLTFSICRNLYRQKVIIKYMTGKKLQTLIKNPQFTRQFF